MLNFTPKTHRIMLPSKQIRSNINGDIEQSDIISLKNFICALVQYKNKTILNIIEKKQFRQIHFQVIEGKVHSFDGVTYTNEYSLVLLILNNAQTKGIHILKTEGEYYNIKEDNQILKINLVQAAISVDLKASSFILLDNSVISRLYISSKICRFEYKNNKISLDNPNSVASL